MLLATAADYVALYGPVEDVDTLEVRLAAASSLVQDVAKQDICRVVDDHYMLEDDGSGLVQLPQHPVISVASVEIAGVVIDPSRWRLLGSGQVRLRDHRRWGPAPCDPDLIDVTNTHGYDPIPPWIVERVCSMVQRATRPEAIEGIRQETTGGQAIAYATTAAGANLWLTQAETKQLRAAFPPVIA